MKFCKFKTFEQPKNNTVTVYNYVTLEDVEKFHGIEFKNQFYSFISKNLKPSIFGKEEGYYFIDYQFYAQRTKLYLET